jgi:filamentous hemagglutinin family protein
MYKSRSEGNAFQVRILAAAVASCFVSAALANPTGGVPVQGTVSMTPVLGQLHITNSPNSIIHWNSFSIGAGELTKFIQESASSAVLNRVVTPGSLSEILGTLQSNGRVFLINPNGITIGAGAVLDLPGFVASSLDMTDADFTAGRMRFQQALGVVAGTVTNQASVFMPDGGQVYLIGGTVVNEPGGFINSPNGEVVLAAGHSVELMSAAVPGVSVAIAAPENEAVNLGQIFAGAGSVGIFGGVINQGGVVSANDAFFGPGGTIQLRATGATTLAAGSITSAGDLQIDTGSLAVAGLADSRTQSIRASGGVVVENAPGGFAQLSAMSGQSIEAGFVEVNAVAGGNASIFSFGGEQSIETSGANGAGEGIAVRAFDGGFATIDSPFAPQTIAVRNADRLVVEGASGSANVNSFGGTQSISLTGGGDNALVLGSPDARFQSLIGANDQTILAGNPDERGSITVHGTADGSFGTALLLTFSGAGGSQTVSTSGALSVFGGSAPGNSATGIFANQAGGHQTIRAGSILLQGGGEGGGNSAMIGANDGSQTINVGAGGITLRGGETGGNNFAMINQVSTDPSATQSIASAGPVQVEGGSGNFNFAMIRAFGGHQAFEAGDTTLLAGAGGIDNFSTIQGRAQDMAVHGDLAIVARGSGGSPTVGGGARIGGLGGAAPSATNLALDVGGNLTMTAGSVSGTGVSFGGNIVDDLPSNVAATVGGNVTLHGGTAPDTFARVGSANSGATGGSIDITAGGAIALNSSAPDQASIIRTTDDVALTAQQITQGPDARIEAGSLTTHTTTGASLGGANSVNELAMLNSASGDIAFNNTSALLTVTGIDQVPHGALALSQDGDLLVSGDVTSGAQTISATGDMTIRPGIRPNVTVRAHGAQTFNVGGSFGLLAGDAWNGYAQTLASGAVSITTGNDLLVRGGGGLLAYALLYGGDDIHLTVGNELRIDGGSGPFAYARVQTDFWDRIYLTFPNRASGGYFINGREGVTRRGLDGLFTGLLPAIRNRSLIVSYGD